MTFDTINNAATIAGNGVGTLLANRYRVVRQLGQGGMGSVWLAEDTQLDNKPFAIKMLPAILVSNKRAYRQLKDEALVAMRLVHPNIVQIRAFEENDGNPFLVMDYIDGQTLDDYLADYNSRVEHVERVKMSGAGRDARPARPFGGLSEADVLRILRPIAAALDYAHGEGVVHRDVKPANVMIRKDGHPFILDFGIAREIQETMTRVTGKLSSGTLLYMSPEQLNGEQPRPAQDIYSFAAMAYECLKGEPPFLHGQIEFQIMNKQPEPLPGGTQLVASVMSGLSKKPSDRPRTCSAVLEENGLSRVEHVERVDFVRRGAFNALQPDRDASPRQPSQNGAWKILPFVIALALAITCGITWWGLRDESPRKTVRYDRPSGKEGVRKPEVRNLKEGDAVSMPLPASNGPTQADVAEIAVEASVQKECLTRIDGADGFKDKKEEVSEQLTRATSYGKAKRWKESAQAFSNYVARCKELVRLDGERKLALNSKVQAQEAFQEAEAEGAKTYAVSNWNAAVGVWRKASDLFSRMAFSQADRTFSSAAEHFRKCADEVMTARENEAAAQIQKAEDFLKLLQKSSEEVVAAEAELERANRYLSRLQAADPHGITQRDMDDARVRVEKAKQAMVQARTTVANKKAPKNLPLRSQIEETCRVYRKACLDIERMRESFTDKHPRVVGKNAEIHTVLSNMKDQIAQALLSLATIRQTPDVLTAFEHDIFTFEFFKESLFPSLQQCLESPYEAYCKACTEQHALREIYTEEHPEVKAAASRADAALAAFKETLQAYKKGEQSSALKKHLDTYVVQPGDSLTTIAMRFYGLRSKWRDIRDANKATVPLDGRLRVGLILGLPDVAAGSAASDVQQGMPSSAIGEARFERAKKMRENRSPAWLKTGDTKTIALPGGATMEMIYCEPGTFVMGSAPTEEGRIDNECQHRVTLTKGFWLGKYEVTQEQWQSVMGTNPSHFKGEKLPVECVSWEDCQLFIQRVNATLNYGARLPTEAEWEYACRAGTTGAYGGNGDLNDMGWYDDNSGGETHCVGQKQANAWGFYDMHGNVAEWCAGSYEASGEYDAPIESRMLCGGSRTDKARSCRSAYRLWGFPGLGDFTGLRLCFSAE